MTIKRTVSLFLIFSIIFVLYVNVSAASPVTWNPNDKGTFAVLSNGNLTVTGTENQNASIRATEARTSGKWYWEIRCNAAVDDGYGVGIAESSANLNIISWADTTNQRGYRSGYIADNHGSLWTNHSSQSTAVAHYDNNNIIGVALDLDNKTLEFYKNGIKQTGKFTDLSNVPYYPWVYVSSGSVASSITANFGPTGFQYSVPTGFLPYNNVVQVASVSLDRTSISLDIGQDTTLVPTVLPANATDKSVTWSSSDATVASVDSTGKVTALKAGTATITVTTVDGGYTATCNVTVTTPHRAVFTITMTNGAQKEYDLSMAQVDAFLTWYDNRAGGTGSAYFVFYKSYNIKPFVSRRDYVIFDKILDFEVCEYIDS